MDDVLLKISRNLYMPLEQNERQKARRCRQKPSHRWSEAQRLELLHAVEDEVKDSFESFEKPIAQKFYDKIAQKSIQLKPIHWTVMKSKMRHIRTTYSAAFNWKINNSEFITYGENTVVDYINKICPNFDLVDKIFGQRNNIDPLVIIENSLPSQDPSLEPEETSNSLSPKPTSIQSGTDITEPRPKLRMRQRSKQKYSNKFSLLLLLQENRLQLEARKFELQKDTTHKELQLKRMQMDQEFELKKLEIEKNERFQKYDLELKRLKLDQEFELKKMEIEKNERVQKYELELKFNKVQF